MILDSHHHFWKYDPLSHGWIDDDMQVLKKDFLPAEFSHILRAHGVEGTIAVQTDQSLEETYFLLDLARENEFIKGVVGWVDFTSDEIHTKLDSLSQHKKLVGFRHILQSEPDPNFILQDRFQHGLSSLSEFDFTYDILVFPHQMEGVVKTLETLPNQKFVIDHLAKPYIKKNELGAWSEQIRIIASHEHVMCKLSGMVTEADWNHWTYGQFVPFLDVVFESFGTDRVMFGSDWPVCLLAADYGKVKQVIDDYVKDFSEAEKANVFGNNAAKFYGV